MEPIVSKSLSVSLNQHRSHGPILSYSFHSNISMNVCGGNGDQQQTCLE